jgi:hypothetical protein
MRCALLLLLLGVQSCVTWSGDKLAEIDPPAAVGCSSIESSFRDFNYTLDGGALHSSASMADKINDGVKHCWLRHGYASSFIHRGRNPGTGNADYTLTLSGNLDGESSVVMQVISGLTLLLIPHAIDAHAYLTFELKRTKDGATFKVSAAEDVHQLTWLPLILGLPWMNAGVDSALDKIGLHIYQQFASQGAFAAPSIQTQQPTGAPSAGG